MELLPWYEPEADLHMGMETFKLTYHGDMELHTTIVSIILKPPAGYHHCQHPMSSESYHPQVHSPRIRDPHRGEFHFFPQTSNHACSAPKVK